MERRTYRRVEGWQPRQLLGRMPSRRFRATSIVENAYGGGGGRGGSSWAGLRMAEGHGVRLCEGRLRAFGRV